MPPRRHTARKYYYSDEAGRVVVRLRCQVCLWQSDPSLTEREQREEHRQHRRDQGEEVPDTPLKLLQHERLAALKNLHHHGVEKFSGAVICNSCGDEWPCQTRRLVDGDPTAVPVENDDGA